MADIRTLGLIAGIELTPMIGGNDAQDEHFTVADATTVAHFAITQGLAGVHYWSYDRDTDCAPGSASSTCNCRRCVCTNW